VRGVLRGFTSGTSIHRHAVQSEAVWRAKHAAEEDKLNSKVSRMFACFFASGEFGADRASLSRMARPT